MLAHFQTIHLRQHQIQNDQIRLLFFKNCDSFLAILGLQGIKILCLQKLRNIGSDIGFILYNQNNVFHGVGSSSPVIGGCTATGRQ